MPTVEILVRIKIQFLVHAKVVLGDPAKSLNMTLFTNGIHIPMHICLLTWLVGACCISAGVNDKRSEVLLHKQRNSAMVTPLQTAVLLITAPFHSPPHISLFSYEILFRISKGHFSSREGSHQKQRSSPLGGPDPVRTLDPIKTCFLCSFTHQV